MHGFDHTSHVVYDKATGCTIHSGVGRSNVVRWALEHYGTIDDLVLDRHCLIMEDLRAAA